MLLSLTHTTLRKSFHLIKIGKLYEKLKSGFKKESIFTVQMLHKRVQAFFEGSVSDLCRQLDRSAFQVSSTGRTRELLLYKMS